MFWISRDKLALHYYYHQSSLAPRPCTSGTISSRGTMSRSEISESRAKVRPWGKTKFKSFPNTTLLINLITGKTKKTNFCFSGQKFQNVMQQRGILFSILLLDLRSKITQISLKMN